MPLLNDVPKLRIFSVFPFCTFQRKTKGKKSYVIQCYNATKQQKKGCSERSEQERYSLRFIAFRSFSSS